MEFCFKSVEEAYISLCLLLLFLGSCQSPEATRSPPADAATLEAGYKADLSACIHQLDSLQVSTQHSQRLEHFIRARYFFKRIEPILAFTDAGNYKSLDAPNLLKVEEEDLTSIKVNAPFGFQVLEEQLFEDPFPSGDATKNIAATRSRLQLILDNVFLELKPHHILWLVRDAIVRIALTGITGFDSPVLARSLEEAGIVYERVGEILELNKDRFTDTTVYRQWKKELHATGIVLKGDFSSFDRYAFIRDHTHPQMALWVKTVSDWGITFPFELAIRNEARDLFSVGTFSRDYFGDNVQEYRYSPEKAALGELLFNDARLSGNGKMSCATCHQQDKAFTDGLRVFKGQVRNTPTLLYASLQQGFFYDNREGSLEGQIVGVIHHEEEFHTTLDAFRDVVIADTTYLHRFKALYNGRLDDYAVRNALAHYVRSLTPFNSRFDRSIRGQEALLAPEEIKGFNLFMGKAKCATCHFPPAFNGTVPPAFADSELESIGVPADTTKPAMIDTDPGRFNVFGTAQRRHFFKTPTVRNISLTAPYMHNGVYTTLEEVMNFYNHGGGTGLGIELENQTLPFDSLQLSTQEVSDLIAFLKSLEDEY